MKYRYSPYLIVVSIVSLIMLVAVGFWIWGVPFLYIDYTTSTQLAPHANSWTELGRAVSSEEDEKKILQLIHKDPSQLTMPQPPIGGLPLEIALAKGNNNITALLFFEVDQVYRPEQLIRLAKQCIRLQEYDHLRMLRTVVPLDRVDWYRAELEELLKQAGLDELGIWPKESGSSLDADPAKP